MNIDFGDEGYEIVYDSDDPDERQAELQVALDAIRGVETTTTHGVSMTLMIERIILEAMEVTRCVYH